ncbi:small ribosomal subunit protein bS16m-like [Clavelina lepadiformis]|uniref:Small ribosomal subunit protein bS16m n=1 Tax=Clavelina lepadiformis TaxID=159417 RepID=A0ABP0F686_CLALP
MVRLSRLLRLRKSGFDTPLRVSRFRYVAHGANSLFQNAEVEVVENFDGTCHLKSGNIIRLALDGCTNRPFYRIVVSKRTDPRDCEMEQIGTFDPMPNMLNEKLCSINFERLKYHLALGAHPVKSVRRLIGLSGFLPLDPTLLIFAEGLKRRRKIEELISSQGNATEDDESSNS